MDEPLYGFIVEVTVSENQTCQISPSSEENIMQQCQLLRDDNENDIANVKGLFQNYIAKYQGFCICIC